MPLFKILGRFCPSKTYICDRLVRSCEEWDALAENEGDELKKYYVKSPLSGFLDESWV